MVLEPGYLNFSLAARDGVLSSLRCLTWLWGAHAFLLGCCGVPGAEVKPMGCSLQPAPTARHGQATDMVDINMTMELFSLGQEKQIVPQGQVPHDMCAWRPVTLPALGTR